MKNAIIFLILFFPLFAGGQQTIENSTIIEGAVLKWLINLDESGLELQNDSLIIGQEFLKVLQDEAYRSLIFPETYSWQQIMQFIQNLELKQALWYMINLYPENETNKEMVIYAILAYDKLFKMDNLLVNSFYTYCYLDPESSVINDGVPELIRPDILENKLASLREIINYLQYFRNNPHSAEQ